MRHFKNSQNAQYVNQHKYQKIKKTFVVKINELLESDLSLQENKDMH